MPCWLCEGLQGALGLYACPHPGPRPRLARPHPEKRHSPGVPSLHDDAGLLHHGLGSAGQAEWC
eukprot:7885904-Alexandrium_andersonii.AAC.1